MTTLFLPFGDFISPTVKRRVVGLPTVFRLSAKYIWPFSILIKMPIFQALGIGLVIIIFQLFVPRIFHAVEEITLSTLNTAQVLMSISQEAISDRQIPLLPREE